MSLNPSVMHPQRPLALATDLDGTLIPLEDRPGNLTDLSVLREAIQRSEIPFAFATGRHFESALDALDRFDLPPPGWMICDVGASLYDRDGEDYTFDEGYAEALRERMGGHSAEDVLRFVEEVPGLRPQEDTCQGRFKISFYCAAEEMEESVRSIQQALKPTGIGFSVVGSVDPFEHIGQIDVLPAGVDKAFAVDWWRQHRNLEKEQVVYAGDSGNDLAALTSGFLSVAVNNMRAEVKAHLERAYGGSLSRDHLYFAEGEATSGLLEGCRHFGLIREGQ